MLKKATPFAPALIDPMIVFLNSSGFKSPTKIPK
jgi:hypothetical protein